MGMSALLRLARTAPAPVFAAAGPGCSAAVDRLMARPSLRRVETPRAAAILLVAGEIPDRAAEALDRIHDQLPHPRRTVHWDGMEEIEGPLLDAWREILDGGGTEPDRCLDTPPNEWQGKGDHGQGGEGMMGGTPYGRPMAMTGPDFRDGLQLDRYTARIGPFAPMLPPGLVLEVTLQGDVIVEATVQTSPFDQPAEADTPDLGAARMLRLLGLGPAAEAVLRGSRPRALGIRHAVPRGLGQIGGTDARDRLSRWLAGRTVSVGTPPLPDLLHGLEWSEAALVLASLPPSALTAATATATATATEEAA